MIVRDEAELLSDFLRHAAGLYDELCVVDTGSTDDTMAIMSAAGARLESFPWQDDFAQARNVSLTMARGDWIIYLDPDELPSEALVADARQKSACASVGAAAVAMRNTLPGGNSQVTCLLRMFRRHDSIRFEHAIHEDIVQPVRQRLEASGQTLAHLTGEVEHLGYTRGRAAQRHKKERDMRILRRSLEENPSDLYNHYKLMELARFWDDRPLLSEAAHTAQRCLEEADKGCVRTLHYMGELLTLLTFGISEHHTVTQLAYLLKWESGIEPNAAFHLRCGELYEIQGDHKAAAGHFERCLALRPRTTNQQLAGVRPLVGLARLAIAQQDHSTALELLNEGLSLSPRDPEALLALAFISRKVGGRDAARAVTEAYVETYGGTPELHGAMGEAALQAGDRQVATEQLTLALQAAPDSDAYATLLQQAQSAGPGWS